MLMGVKPLDGALDLVQVLLLLEQLERPGVDGLEADVHVEAVASPHEFQHLRVIDGLGPDLGAPVRGHAVGDHPREQFLGASLVGGEDVVGEEDIAGIPVALQLFHDAGHRVGPEGMAVHAGHGTEGARKRAPAGGGNADDAAALPAVNQIERRDGVGVQVPDHGPLGVMDAPSLSPVGEVPDAVEGSPTLQGLQQLHEGALTLSADHVVRVLQAFLGQERRVRSSQHHRDAGRPDRFGQGVRGRGGGGDGGDPDEVGAQDLLHVDGGDVFDVDPDVVAQVAQDGPEQHHAEAGNRDTAVHVQVGGLGLHQHDLTHDTSPSDDTQAGPGCSRAVRNATMRNQGNGLTSGSAQHWLSRYRRTLLMSTHLSPGRLGRETSPTATAHVAQAGPAGARKRGPWDTEGSFRS